MGAAERPSRVDAMKRYLEEHAAEIEGWDFGHVHFDWNPGDIKTHIGRSDRIGANGLASARVAHRDRD